jgi:hypothetical protein
MEIKCEIDIGTILQSIIAAFGLFFVWLQLKIQNKQLKMQNEQLEKQKDTIYADFYLKLFAEFRAYESLFEKIDSWTPENNTFKNFAKDKGLIVAYCGFLESMYQLEKRGVLTMEQIDESFAYSFFKFVNNRTIQEKEIFVCKDYYKNLFRLYKKWADYRRKRGFKVEDEEFGLDETNAYKEFIESEKNKEIIYETN